jgi:hypothetical protein
MAFSYSVDGSPSTSSYSERASPNADHSCLSVQNAAFSSETPKACIPDKFCFWWSRGYEITIFMIDEGRRNGLLIITVD